MRSACNRWAVVGAAISIDPLLMRLHCLLLLIPFPALSETWTGHPEIVDGDSLKFNGLELRLYNIDAFETDQRCHRDGIEYGCGIEATLVMTRIIAGRPVTCEGSIRDRYGRPLVRCSVEGEDIGRAMVRSGWALAEFRPAACRADQEYAQTYRLGAWARTFQRPLEYRRERRRIDPNWGSH